MGQSGCRQELRRRVRGEQYDAADVLTEAVGRRGTVAAESTAAQRRGRRAASVSGGQRRRTEHGHGAERRVFMDCEV